MGGGRRGHGAPPLRCPQGQGGDTEWLRGGTEELWGCQPPHPPHRVCPHNVPKGGVGTRRDYGGGYGPEGDSTPLCHPVCVPLMSPRGRVGGQRGCRGTWRGCRGTKRGCGDTSDPTITPCPPLSVPKSGVGTWRDYGVDTKETWGGPRGASTPLSPPHVSSGVPKRTLSAPCVCPQSPLVSPRVGWGHQKATGGLWGDTKGTWGGS